MQTGQVQGTQCGPNPASPGKLSLLAPDHRVLPCQDSDVFSPLLLESGILLGTFCRGAASYSLV